VAELVGTDLGRRVVAMALDDPGPVAGVLERMERLAQLVDGGEAADSQQILLQRPYEGKTVCPL